MSGPGNARGLVRPLDLDSHARGLCRVALLLWLTPDIQKTTHASPATPWLSLSLSSPPFSTHLSVSLSVRSPQPQHLAASTQRPARGSSLSCSSPLHISPLFLSAAANATPPYTAHLSTSSRRRYLSVDTSHLPSFSHAFARLVFPRHAPFVVHRRATLSTHLQVRRE